MRYDCLIIDDEQTLADNTCEYFNMFEVKTAAVYDSRTALSFLEENEVGLILLDINLTEPGSAESTGSQASENDQIMSGFELCKKIRETLNIPILFISARNTDDDKLIALNIGGDDYIEKPYSLGVLLAKVRVVLKRYGVAAGAGAADDAEKDGDYDDGHLRVDGANMTIHINGEEKRITNMEFKLLKYLTDNPDRLITKTELFENVWGDKFTTDGTLNVHIRKLREEIEVNPKEPAYIVTVWKEGYRFNSGMGKK